MLSFHRVLPTPHLPPPYPRPSFPLTWAQTTFLSVLCAVGCQGEESPTLVGQGTAPWLLAPGGLVGSQAVVVPTTSPWTRRTWQTNWALLAWQVQALWAPVLSGKAPSLPMFPQPYTFSHTIPLLPFQGTQTSCLCEVAPSFLPWTSLFASCNIWQGG